MRVAVIGLGAMGGAIARRLLSRGHDVIGWNRTGARAQELAVEGAAAAATPADAAAGAEAVITMVADPAALHAVTAGPHGVLAGAAARATILQMSTVGVEDVLALARRTPRGVSLLDTPVMGAGAAAAAGELHIFAGGPADAVRRMDPLLGDLGRTLRVGGVGAASAAKLVANGALLSVVAALGESLALAQALGLAPETAWEVLEATPLAEQARRRRPAVEAGDHPARFALDLARKDADLVMHAARAAGADVRVAAAVAAWFADAADAGWGRSDYVAVIERILGRAPA